MKHPVKLGDSTPSSSDTARGETPPAKPSPKKALSDVVRAIIPPIQVRTKFTNIQMDWTDTGARVLSSVAIHCPACGVEVDPDIEHLCGDRVPKPRVDRVDVTLKTGQKGSGKTIRAAVENAKLRKKRGGAE